MYTQFKRVSTNLSVNYLTAGILPTLSLILLLSSCCTLSDIFRPNDPFPNCSPPVAAFSASSTNVQQGARITFTDQSIGEDIQWSWTFTGGNPMTSTSQNPTVTYTQIGTYEVSLTVRNSRGTDTETRSGYIVVNPRTLADFDASPKIIKAGEAVFFNDRSTGNIATRNWVFQGGVPESATGKSPRVTYNTPGTYWVKLEVIDFLNFSDSEIKNNFIKVTEREEIVEFKPNPILDKCPAHTEGDRDFNGHGPEVVVWAELRVEGRSKIYLDYYIKARETRYDWTTAENKWSDLLWTSPGGTSIVKIISDKKSEATYTDTNHKLDIPLIRGGNLVQKFEVMGDTRGNDVGNCTTDDVYLNIYLNPIKVEIKYD